ncbi:hypothetical protein TREES_T100003820 [Tupaia chinensis]|uniref:Uncharacterized protein n=1 Tax=Tupaia chinensis TaxID=246437 RepID=L9L6F4_TUPCH|nr:hypothetical protein TREES_T100003820 [Tupaia chinensis]
MSSLIHEHHGPEDTWLLTGFCFAKDERFTKCQDQRGTGPKEKEARAQKAEVFTVCVMQGGKLIWRPGLGAGPCIPRVNIINAKMSSLLNSPHSINTYALTHVLTRTPQERTPDGEQVFLHSLAFIPSILLPYIFHPRQKLTSHYEFCGTELGKGQTSSCEDCLVQDTDLQRQTLFLIHRDKQVLRRSKRPSATLTSPLSSAILLVTDNHPYCHLHYYDAGRRRTAAVLCLGTVAL